VRVGPQVPVDDRPTAAVPGVVTPISLAG
jgi:hypothetical protein